MPRRSFFMYPENSEDDGIGDNIFDFVVFPCFNCYSILSGCIELVWEQMTKLPSMLYWLFTFMYSIFGYYLMWITLHYLAVHMYPMYCAPLTIIGFILSTFMVSTPHCIAMRWLITEGSNVIVTMWLAIGAYVIQRMLRRPNNV